MLRPNKIGYVILIGIEGKLCAISPKCRKEVTKTTDVTCLDPDWKWTAAVTSTFVSEYVIQAPTYFCQ